MRGRPGNSTRSRRANDPKAPNRLTCGLEKRAWVMAKTDEHDHRAPDRSFDGQRPGVLFLDPLGDGRPGAAAMKFRPRRFTHRHEPFESLGRPTPVDSPPANHAAYRTAPTRIAVALGSTVANPSSDRHLRMSAEHIRRRAMVTGASRGIGKATALALANAGWDVAITGRTRRAGEGRDDSDTGGGRSLPGSLEETAGTIRESGRKSLELVADLHDPLALRSAVDRVVAEWGGVDLLVNNAVDTGPGSMVGMQELTVGQMESKLAANVVAQLVLVQAVLPGMLEQGSGFVVDVTSHVATADPPGPVGQGGLGPGLCRVQGGLSSICPAVSGGIRRAGDPGLQPGSRVRRNRASAGQR